MRRIRTVIVASVLAGAATLAPAVAAHGSSAQCANGEICVWENANYSGGFAFWVSADIKNFASGYKFDNGDSMNDHISSLWNRTSHYVYFYPAKNYGGGYDLSQSPGGSRQNLAVDSANTGLKLNDTFSSELVGS